MQFTVSMRSILDLAVKLEQGGEEFYRRIASLTKDPKVKQICLFFADQEKEHIQAFKKITRENNVDIERDFSADIISLMNQEIAKVKETGFQSPSFDFTQISLNQCLELALNVELATVAIYEEIRQEMDTNYNIVLYKIIHEENDHVKFVENVLKELDPKRKPQIREAKIVRPDKVEIREIKIQRNGQDLINIAVICLSFLVLIAAMTGPKYISYIINAVMGN